MELKTIFNAEYHRIVFNGSILRLQIYKLICNQFDVKAQKRQNLDANDQINLILFHMPKFDRLLTFLRPTKTKRVST